MSPPSPSGKVPGLPETFTTPELRVDVADEIKFKVVKAAQDHFAKSHKTIDVDGVRVLFEDNSWGLIRASNTQPALVLRFEADTQSRLDEVRAYVEKELGELKRKFE